MNFSSPPLSDARSRPIRILHLEDSLPDAELIAHRITSELPGCEIRHAEDRPQFEAALTDGRFDLILSDYTLRGFDGLSALELARTRRPGKPFIFLSGTIGEERAIDALKRGATDYVIKDRPSRLIPAIRQALDHAHEEERFHAAEERIRQQAALLDRAQDAILVRDMEDRVTYWNQSAARIYGWTAAEAVGRETTGLWNEDPAQVEIARHATLFYGEWTGEMRQRSRTGAELVMQSRWSLVQNPEGTPGGFLVINTDVAERKRLEAQFLRVQRVESIGLLASGVAHDINNVLVPILASTELLETMNPDPEAKQFLASIRASAQHGAALVRQLLAFARGAVGQHTELALPPLLEDFVAFTTQTFPKNVSLELVAPGDTWPVRGDATQLKQIFLNLCLNARDAMPGGGAITVRLSNVVLSELDATALREVKAGPHTLIEVSDNGSGMPPAVLAKIFDPFFTTKALGKGTGLGLAAVRGIVKGHGGAITVESELGAGTNFRIYLPAITAGRRESAPPIAMRQPQGAGQSILLVDDEATVRDILCSLLVASGYRVFKSASAAEGLATYRTHRDDIALVLTDVMMSDGDGFEFAAQLRRENCVVPILAMSGLAGNSNYEAKAHALGIPLLGKPLTRDALIRAVQTALAASTPPFS